MCYLYVWTNEAIVSEIKLFYSILFYSILFYSILFYSILFYSILFYSILPENKIQLIAICYIKKHCNIEY